MSSIIALFPELLLAAWFITLFYRINRRLARIETELDLRKNMPPR